MTANSNEPPRVFLSYSWDSESHKQRVLDLAQKLRNDGIDAWLDRFTTFPPEGWPRWMEKEITGAKFIVVVATEKYAERFSGTAQGGTGLGANWEGAIITQQIYEAGGCNVKFLPAIFTESDKHHIPTPLRSYTHFQVDSESGYTELYRILTNQPEVIPAALGKPRNLSNTLKPKLPALGTPAIHDVQSSNPSSSNRRRILFSVGLLVALSVASGFFLTKNGWIRRSSSAPSSTEFGNSKVPSIREHYDSDFGSYFARKGPLRVASLTWTQSFEASLCADFTAKSEFLVFYVPDSPFTFQICQYLAVGHTNAIAFQNDGVIVEVTGFGDRGTELKDLRFSGRIFIYHEYPLTTSQQDGLQTLFASKGLSLQLRGYEYRYNRSARRAKVP